MLGFGPCPFQHHKGRELVVFVPKGSEQQLVFECLDPLQGAMRAAGAGCAALVPRVERCRATVDAVLVKLKAAEVRQQVTVALGDGEDAATARSAVTAKAQRGDHAVVFELCTRLVPDWSADDELGSCAPLSGGMSGAALFKVQRKQTADGGRGCALPPKWLLGFGTDAAPASLHPSPILGCAGPTGLCRLAAASLPPS